MDDKLETVVDRHDTTALHLHLRDTIARGSGGAARILHGLAAGLGLVQIVTWNGHRARTHWELATPLRDEDGHITEMVRDASACALMDRYGFPDGFSNAAVARVDAVLDDIDWTFLVKMPSMAGRIAIAAWTASNPLAPSTVTARVMMDDIRRQDIVDRLAGQVVPRGAVAPTYAEIAQVILEEGARGAASTRDARMMVMMVAALRAARQAG